MTLGGAGQINKVSILLGKGGSPRCTPWGGARARYALGAHLPWKERDPGKPTVLVLVWEG